MKAIGILVWVLGSESTTARVYHVQLSTIVTTDDISARIGFVFSLMGLIYSLYFYIQTPENIRLGTELVQNEAGKRPWLVAMVSWAFHIVAYFILISGLCPTQKIKGMVKTFVVFATANLMLSIYVLVIADKIMTGLGMALGGCTIVASIGAICETRKI